MAGSVKMPGGVFIFRRITAANVPADKTGAQVHPGIAHSQAFFAAVCAGFYIPVDLFAMLTGHKILLKARFFINVPHTVIVAGSDLKDQSEIAT